ncbi:hypothetical protein [Cryobacterium luteum]|uniref:PH domain-containing protein n=2 Tax=Cryobacterium TaxID=69578 RepID=A0A5F0D2P7_9MICO|nr:hypothetical protein [Cryobacterium luteum]TFB88435.1 hypothetical protein E3O10_11515 [Cryobacterium luteum]
MISGRRLLLDLDGFVYPRGGVQKYRPKCAILKPWGNTKYMVREGLEPADLHVLRPRKQLVARALIAALSLLLPLLLVLYWLTIPRNTWMFVATVQLGLTILAVVAVCGVRRMTVTVTAARVESRNLLGRVTAFDTSAIASVVLVNLYQSGTLDTLTHLYLLDSAGEVLLRLRGQVWPRSGLEELVDTLGVAVLRPPDPLTMADLGRLRPQLVRRRARRAARQGVS